jgi:hypothetical protein
LANLVALSTQWVIKPLSCQRMLWQGFGYALANLVALSTQWVIKPLSCQRMLWQGFGYALANLVALSTQWVIGVFHIYSNPRTHLHTTHDH